MQHSLANARRGERGVSIIILALFIVALFGFAALSVDLARVYQQQRLINYATDAGALAGVVVFTNASATAVDAVTMATAITQGNGVTAEEIVAGAMPGFPGQIQAGNWNNNVFTPNGSPLNAVRVPARRTVNLLFGKVVGMSQMTPVVHSIAFLGPVGSVTGNGGGGPLIPYGIEQAATVGAGYNTTIDGKQSPGNWGKLALASVPNDPTGGGWGNWMQDGYPGTVRVGDSVGVQPGVAHLASTLQGMVGEIVTVPIVDSFGNGRKDVTVTGFAAIKLMSVSGNGNNLDVKWQFLDSAVGNGGGGASGPPFAKARMLVQ